MTQLVRIQLDDGTKLYIEATEGVQIPTLGEGSAMNAPAANGNPPVDPDIEQPRQGQKGFLGNSNRGLSAYPGQDSVPSGQTVNGSAAAITQNFQAIESTIRTYTNYTMRAFKDMAHANVDKVTLQFGIRIGGEVGVPYVTRGTAESNLNITVECSFKDS
jgi:Trypsin-co-occurring domain 1